MKKEVYIGILYGDLYSANMGCNALTYSTVFILEEVAKRLGVDFRYIITETAAKKTKNPPNNFKITNFDILDSFYKPWRVIFRSNPKRILRSIYNNRKNFKKLDICFCATAGDSFSDIYGNRFYYMLKTMSYPIKKRVPLILLPQTVGPFLSKKSEKTAISFLNKVHAVFVRDPKSMELVHNLVPYKFLYNSIDMAFFLPGIKKEKATSKIRVGINPSGLLWNGGYTMDNQFNLRETYPDVIRKTIEYFYQLENVEIELVAHVLGGPYFSPIEDDYRICKLLKKDYPACSIAPYFYDPIEAKSYISGLDFLIASRMHCCIAGYSSGVPVLPFGYSRKFNGLFQDGLDYEHIVDLKKDSLNSISEKVKVAFSNREEISAEISQKASVLIEKKEELISHLANIVRCVISK